ncbi:hypothetical protein QTP70_005014, partial [Hemibagrus guttatus]
MPEIQADFPQVSPVREKPETLNGTAFVPNVNPPEVQRVVVEHIVKSEEASSHMHTPSKLRFFSGRFPRPGNEMDYETWHSSVELMLRDPAVSDLVRSRRILDSLLPPAADIVKTLGSHASPRDYLDLLDSAFGTVEDGDELFARFLNTLQNTGEKPSQYLQRLQGTLMRAVRRGGVPTVEADRHLLRQFCRGCWDNVLISEFQLEQKKDDPPTFAELLLLLRTVEDKQSAKESRMKKHLGMSKQRTSSYSLYASPEVEAANGQLVPYLGYIEVDVVFPKEFLGTEIKLSTLALVTVDTGGSVQSSVLIGTNTLDLVYESQSYSAVAKSNPISPYGFRAIMSILEHRFKQKSNCIIGSVRIPGTKPAVVPAGQALVLEGLMTTPGPCSDKWAILEPPSESFSPGGLLCPPCLITLPLRPSKRIPVTLKNETDHDIVVPAKSVIAELHSLQSVITNNTAAENNSEGEVVQPFVVDFGESPMPSEWKTKISQRLWSMAEVFALHDLDFGRTGKVTHRIRLHDETPFKQRARPIHPQDYDAVRKHLQELLDAGVIRESESSFSSPIVVVRKKNGDVRLCIDYRKLNSQTSKDVYALPNLEETFSALTGSCWFSVLDLKSGYYQIEVEESDKHKTAFVCPLGFWEFNRMPQGVTNAPSTFQRLMERCMSDIHLKEVVVFLDDLIVFSDTLEEHERRLMSVLKRLKEYGLKLSPEKCKFFQTSVKYLGHIVSSDGVETDPDKVEVLKSWPVPKNLKELRSFLGFAGYYRRFIRDFAKIAKPLNSLTSGYPPFRKSSKSKEKRDYHDPKEPFGSRWSANCQQAFESIIEALTTAPVLGFADPKLPYVLHTDASTVGLGAALYQEQDGLMKVIAYASRGLSQSESRYPAHKLEFLALKWAVTEKFYDYLYGNQFTVVTDSNPLTYVLTSAKLDSTSYRWLSALSTFSFKLQFRAGKQNVDADSLSRRPQGGLISDIASRKEQERVRQFIVNHLLDEDVSTVSEEVTRAICERHTVHHNSATCADSPFALVESLAMHVDAIPCSFDQNEICDNLSETAVITEDELRENQRSDPVICEVIRQLET